MKKEILTLLILATLISFVSAEVVIMEPSKPIYNIDDNLELTIKIIASQQISGILKADLICGSAKTEVYKEFISLNQGEKFRDLSVPLTKNFIGNSLGKCNIDYYLNSEKLGSTQSFTISNKINLQLGEITNNFAPGEKIIIKGTAIKENGDNANGIIETTFSKEISNNLIFSNIVKDGQFILEVIIPEKTKAGDYSLPINVYEKFSGEIINKGYTNLNIKIKQVPTNLEIILDNTMLNPGETLRGKTILHDQTGDNINAQVYIAIKNQDNEIVGKIETTTNNYFDYKINETERPNPWKVSALSKEIKNEIYFKILELKKIKSEIIDNTLIITNVGNVPYINQTTLQIGEQTKILDLALNVGESEKFNLKAPNGVYLVKLGDYSKEITLTGRVVDAKKLSEKRFLFSPLIWIFIIIILGFLTYTIFRKSRKKTFKGAKKHFPLNMPVTKVVAEPVRPIKGDLISTRNSAEISTSIQGAKQNSAIVLLHLKNFEEIGSGHGNVKESVQKIINIAENCKAIIYENRSNLFMILSPQKTRTFDNEMTAIKIAQEADSILKNHNKVFKQKINYGIGIETGEIILKSDKEHKFAPVGTTLINVKKMAHLSNNEIALTEKIRNKLQSNIRADKKEFSGYSGYILKEVISKSGNSTFIKGFMSRMERDGFNK
jgi:hypothetical protein